MSIYGIIVVPNTKTKKLIFFNITIMIITYIFTKQKRINKKNIKIRSPPPNFLIKTLKIKFLEELIMLNQYIDEIKMYFELYGNSNTTNESYLRRINDFLKYVEIKNDTINNITINDIQQYILYLKTIRKLSAGTINIHISSIKFFYTTILDKEWNYRKIPRMKYNAKMPVIPSRDTIIALLNGTSNLKHKAILYLLYGSGLRVGEVAKLKIGDVSSKAMTIRIDNAKHNTNRYAILSEAALIVLRDYFKQYIGKNYKLDDWLFKGQDQTQHINVKSIKNTIIKLKDKLQINEDISSHTLRHAFSTNSLENGVEPVLIQQMLGHRHFKTTTKYLHMTSKSMLGIKSPLDVYCGDNK